MLSPIEEIKSRLDIIEVIGSYIKLQKAGANYRAVCPFHSEKKPSFFVSPARQIWHCFGGCGFGGGIFDFVMKIEGVEFGDALKILAQRAGVQLKRESPELRSERQRLYEICEWACKFFEKQLEESSTGKLARQYLQNRGVNEQSLKKWRIGYAPDVWQGLADFLNSRGYNHEEIVKAGLGLTSEKGSFYDRFRGRIIFPVFDGNSQVIGFGGRIFGKAREEKEVAKYVNTPQTLLYDKSRTLYGLDKAKLAIRKKDSCILVEGYMDLIMVSQAGFENVVATSGTALTFPQLKILKRYSENLLTSFDMDSAGDAATKRGIELAQHEGFNLKVITFPGGKDPAELILNNPEEWQRRLEEAKSIMDFYFQNSFDRFNRNTPEGKKDIAKSLLPVIKRIPNKIEQSHWIGELAKGLQVAEGVIEEELKKVSAPVLSTQEDQLPEKLPEGLKPRRELLEERLLQMIIKSPQSKDMVEEAHLVGFSPQIKEILGQLKTGSTEEMPPQLEEFFNCLALKSDVEDIEEKDIEPEIRYCLKEIHLIEVRKKLDFLSREIKKAEHEKNASELERLMQEFNSCSKSICDSEPV